MTSTLAESERFIDLHHGKTRYFDEGDGPAVILLHGHGFTAGGLSWARSIEALSPHFRVLAPDMVGWGTGDRVERHLAFPYCVQFVREFQDALGLSKTHVIGQVYGGWIAQLLAYESPERVDKLVLVTSAGHAADAIPAHFQEPFHAPTRQSIVDRIAAIEGLSEEDAARMVDTEWQNTQVKGAEAGYVSMLDHMLNIEERRFYETPRRWAYIKAPTLVVSGTDDVFYTPDIYARIAAGLPNARQLVLDAGHNVLNDRPKELNEAIIDFLLG